MQVAKGITHFIWCPFDGVIMDFLLLDHFLVPPQTLPAQIFSLLWSRFLSLEKAVEQNPPWSCLLHRKWRIITHAQFHKPPKLLIWLVGYSPHLLVNFIGQMTYRVHYLLLIACNILLYVPRVRRITRSSVFCCELHPNHSFAFFNYKLCSSRKHQSTACKTNVHSMN